MTKPLGGFICLGAVALPYITHLVVAGLLQAPILPSAYNALALSVLVLAALLLSMWAFAERLRRSIAADMKVAIDHAVRVAFATVAGQSSVVSEAPAEPQPRRRRRSRKSGEAHVDGSNLVSLPAQSTVAAVRRLAQKVTDGA